MNLEERVGAAMRHEGPASSMPGELVDQIMAGLPERASRRPWWRSASLLAATVGVALLLTAAFWLGVVSGPPTTPSSPAPTPSATPSGNGYAPYVIAQSGGTGTPLEGPRTVSTPADCAFLADEWLRQLCSLTLMRDWRTIPVAPSTQNEGPDPGVWAAISRAQIDGDPSFCLGSLARTLYTAAHVGGSARPPNTTPAPIHPVSECLVALRSNAGAGTFVMEDRGPTATNGTLVTSGPSVTFTVAAGAVTRAAQGVAPAYDPGVGCAQLSWTLCDQVLDLATATLGERQATVGGLGVAGQLLVGCPGVASDAPMPAPCPPPSGGTWLGGVIGDSGGASPHVVVAFDIADVGGQISLVEVPYHQP